MKLPNVKKADKFIMDCNGLMWVYLEEKEVFLVNKDGIQTIKFSDLDEETLQHILEKETHDLSFKTGKETYSIDDLIKE
jgi:hypothetical protein